MEFDDNDIKEAGFLLKIKSLSKEIADLLSEKEELLKVIKDNNLEDEVGVKRSISDEEYICINEIRKLKSASELRDLVPDEVKILDTLFKILRTIKTGKDPEPAKKSKPADIKELFKLVEGSNE